jgi:uncharacterized protein YbjT (DUF2867 family)
MYAVTGITGQVGGAVARHLMESGAAVRAVVRDPGKAETWRARGCEVVRADMTDADALAAAFAGAEGVFVLIPPLFDPAPDFPEVRAVIAALVEAVRRAEPPKLVCLSTVGAQAREPNLLSQLGLVEEALGALPTPVTFLRAAWFMENAAGDVATARETGAFPSFLRPLGRAVPMVATVDVGRVAAEILCDEWQGRRVVELEGPRPVAPDDVATILTDLLGRPVRAEPVARANWEELFRRQGMRHPGPRMRMIDGFNEGWIRFEGEPRRGTTDLATVLRELVAKR